MFLNGFHINLSTDTFHARVKPAPDGEQVHGLRKQFGANWFFHWQGGKVYAIHKSLPGDQVARMSEAQELATAEHLPLLAARLVNALPDVFRDCRPCRYRPFGWIKGRDMMERCLAGIAGVAPILGRFSIRPRYELDAKVIEMVEGEPRLALIANRGMRWEIGATPAQLEDAGVSTAGLFVVKRRREQGKARLVGRIRYVDRGVIHLAESYDELAEIAEDEVWIEGTPASFAHCLRPLLKGQYERYQQNLERVTGAFHASDAVEAMLSSIEEKLCASSPIYLGGGLEANAAGRVRAMNTPTYKCLVQVPPVEYCFDAGRTKRDEIAWRGLTRYGPFSRDTFPRKSPTIVVLFPDSVQRAVENYVSLLRDGVIVPGRAQSAYPGGLAQIYGLTNPKFLLRKVPWFGRTAEDPAQAYRDTVEAFLQERQPADLALVALLDEHAELPDAANPYLYAKAALLMGGVPVQDIRLSKLRQPEGNLQYINQDMSVAMYAKMSGTPWTVNHDRTVNDEIVIGMGTCDVQDSRFESRKRYIGITTVFYGDGNYLLSNLSRECPYEDYPAELRDSTLAVLREVKERNGWRPGDTVRIVFHIPKPLKNVEVADIAARCVAETCGEQTVEFAFLTVTDDHPFALADKDQPGLYGRGQGRYAPARGTVVQVDTFQRLLVTRGPAQIKAGRTGVPAPLLIKLHEQSSHRDLQALSEQVLRFTSMTWRSTRPARVPVTILYSQEIAKLLVRLRAVDSWSPAVLRGRLKASRWFL